MHEIVYLPASGRADLRPFREPEAPRPTDILVETVHVGFCGTDREIVRGGVAVLPPGADALVLGHEMVGKVVEVGAAVERLRPGAVVVPLVRLGCGACSPCGAGRSDFCVTGDYLEFGITRLDGFARPLVRLPQDAVIAVPDDLADVAVLAEPLSVVEKACDQARHALSRIPGMCGDGDRWGEGKRALVAGAGPIGLLSAYTLAERGFEVEIIDVKPPSSLSAALAADAGARYMQVCADEPEEAVRRCRPAEVVLEAAGDPRLAFCLLDALAPGGVMVWIGIPSEQRASVELGGPILRSVLRHHAVVATINAAREHFLRAVTDLQALSTRPRFADIVSAAFPAEAFEQALWPEGEGIKQVVHFNGGGVR